MLTQDRNTLSLHCQYDVLGLSKTFRDLVKFLVYSRKWKNDSEMTSTTFNYCVIQFSGQFKMYSVPLPEKTKEHYLGATIVPMSIQD